MTASTPDPEQEIAAFLREAFESNYELLRVESGRALSADSRQFAWNQVHLYWRKLRELAESVTDTEVRLTLPNQRTPKDRPYAIEGIVDIVREETRTTMYDVKSHEAEYVRQNSDVYEPQLDVYAHIWQVLRGEPLDETAIIATHFPRPVADALAGGEARELAKALEAWDPVIPMDFDASRVDETVAEFGRVVDAIEDGVFAPRALAHLDRREGGTQQRFATAVCANCDARFSCASYRRWAVGRTSRLNQAMRQYFDDLGPAEALEDWRTAGLEAAAEADELRGEVE